MTEYIVKLADGTFLSAFTSEGWTFDTVAREMRAHRFTTMTEAHLVAFMLVLPEGYSVLPTEREQLVMTWADEMHMCSPKRNGDQIRTVL